MPRKQYGRSAAAATDLMTRADVLGLYAQSLGTSGYQKLPSGFMMQWGTSGAPNNGTVTITFPIAFPTACVLLLSTPFASGVSNGIAIASFTMTMNTTGGTVGVRTQTGLTTGASTVPVQWMALGT